MTRGLITGRFCPPHLGHKQLIGTARRRVDMLTVAIDTRANDAIAADLRMSWLKEIHPDCVIELTDNGQLAGADIVFGGDPSPAEYARVIGAKFFEIERARETEDLSSAAILAAPLDNLQSLEPCVRAYFVKRVVLIGAESTGKTTLARHLAEHFDTLWVAEYGRENWEEKIRALTPDKPSVWWTREDFVHIAQEQQRRENEAARNANRVLICDTNAFTTGTWFERYENRRDAEVDAIGALDKADLYLIPTPDVPFVQDGVRDGEMIRDWMHCRFKERLTAGTVPFVELTGSFAERTRRAVDEVEKLLR